MQTKFKIGLIQMSCSADKADNLARAIAMLRTAARQGANVSCVPELFLTPYFCQKEDAALFDLAEPIPGPTTAALAAVARETGMAIVGSLFEKRLPGLYHNTAVVIDADGSQLGIYRKMHVPDDPLYYEKYYFTPGDTGFKTFDTRFARIGTLVCWDQWFPEGARLTALQGASVLFYYPTAIGWHPQEKAEFGDAQHQAWETMQRSHAIANGCYVAAVNRTGHEGALGGGLEFWGASFVSDPFGRVLHRAAHDQEEVIVVECDLKHLEDVRRNWPFLRDRRIDAYGGLTPEGDLKWRLAHFIECPRNGSRTPRPGSPGHTTWTTGRVGLDPVPWVIGDVVRLLSRAEQVCILVTSATVADARRLLGKIGVNAANVMMHEMETDRIWTRDYGPSFVTSKDGRLGAVHWRFNAWAKYDNWHRDVAAGKAIARIAHAPLIEPTSREVPVVLEGGSIDVNGQGLLLTSEECLLSQQQERNPGMNRADYERVFASVLGVRQVIWLKRGIVGDDTHGHVDDLARFVGVDTVVTVVEDDHRDENYEPLQENLELLQSAMDLEGNPLHVVPLPMPHPLYFDGQRLPASYANFYVANGLVLVPTFNDPNDRLALARLAEVFADRQVVGIHCGDLVWGLGTLHCMTQQQPMSR